MIKIALIGCGAVVERYHLPALKKLGIKPAVIVDTDEQRVGPIARRLGAKFVTDFKTAMKEFDAAIVSVPQTLHAPICLELLGNGKHVLIEKPMSTTRSGCEELISAAEETGLKTAVGLFRRYLKGAQWIKAFLQSGGLGNITSFDFREGFIYAWPVTTDSFWRKEKSGGGVLMDTGAHTMDLLAWWLDDVTITEYKDDSYGGVEADCLINISLDSGGEGVVELSRTRKLRGSAIIKGTKGFIEVNLTNNVISGDPPKLLEYDYNGIRASKISPQSHDKLFVSQLKDWLQAINEDAEPFVSGREGVRSVSLIEQCYRIRKKWELPWVEPTRSEREAQK